MPSPSPHLLRQTAADRLRTAIALYREGRLGEARTAGLSVLQIAPDDFNAHQLLGMIAGRSAAYAEALEYFDAAVRLQPDCAEAHYNRGTALADLNRPAEALASYEAALRIKPLFAEAHNNRGEALRELNRHAEALESFKHAQDLRPDYPVAHWNESLCRLVTGDFGKGWEKFEWRWKKAPENRFLRNFDKPLWLGQENLSGKSILLHAEQGFGDTLQFCRYAGQVAARGANVIMEVQPALRPLLTGLTGVAELVGSGEPLPAFDYHCPLLSLPLACAVELAKISGTPYLRAAPQRLATWETRLETSPRPRIGVVWSGNPRHKNDHNRSVPFSAFRSIFAIEASFYCLQKELRENERPAPDDVPTLRILDRELQDFSDTAALIELMDLVITVDTSVAHLAGALGKEAWILLPYAPDWRWLLDRTDSPWYDSVRLFRQPRIGDWASVMTAIVQALRERGTSAQR